MGFINNIQGKKDFTPENETVIQGMKRFFYNIPKIIDIFDKYGKLIWTNKEGHKFWCTEVFQNKETFNLLASYSDSEFEFAGHFNKALLGHVTAYDGISYQHAKNSSFNKQVETIFSPVFSHDGEVSNVVVISTEKKIQSIDKQQISKKSNKKELNETNAFLRNISHELRTPLNWIIGFSDLIKSERDIMKIKAYNEHINKGGKLMLSSIEMLIDISMLQKNEATINQKSFSINNLLEEIRSLLLDEVETINNDLTVKVNNFLQSKNGEFKITSDEDKLKKVFHSLIQNSLKFTREGFIEIGCISAKDNSIMFYVKDSGIGISDDIREYINDLFNRSNEHVSSMLTGKGLGLSIVKKYVETLGGKIWLDSETKKGTTFFFTIRDYSENTSLNVDESNFKLAIIINK